MQKITERNLKRKEREIYKTFLFVQNKWNNYALKNTHNQSFPGGRKGSTSVATIVQVGGGGGGGGTEGIGFYNNACVCGGGVMCVRVCVCVCVSLCVRLYSLNKTL